MVVAPSKFDGDDPMAEEGRHGNVNKVLGKTNGGGIHHWQP